MWFKPFSVLPNMYDFAQYVQKQEKTRELKSSLWIRFIYTFTNIYEFQM